MSSCAFKVSLKQGQIRVRLSLMIDAALGASGRHQCQLDAVWNAGNDKQEAQQKMCPGIPQKI